MTQLQKKVFEQEYDRLIKQPVNKITELELQYMREFFRLNGTKHTENGIALLENAMINDEDKIDLFDAYENALNTEKAWSDLQNDYCFELEERSNARFIQMQANHVVELLETVEEYKMKGYTEELKKTAADPSNETRFEMDVDSGSGIVMDYCHLYRSFHCPKQKYLIEFLRLGYQAKSDTCLQEPFYLSSNYEYTRRVVPKRLLTKELLDEETERVIKEINGYAGKYGKQLNEAKFRSVYRYLLELSIQNEAQLRLKGDTAFGIIWLYHDSVLLHIRPDMFGEYKIPGEVEISYNTHDDILEMEYPVTDAFIAK